MIFIAWVFTVALFLVKITRYADPSWFQVFLPVIIGYGLILILFLLSEAADAWSSRKKIKGAEARRHAAASKVEPLDSIKNPWRR